LNLPKFFYLCGEKFFIMKAIIKAIKAYRERRLRERCVKYAVQVSVDKNITVMIYCFYKFITKGNFCNIEKAFYEETEQAE